MNPNDLPETECEVCGWQGDVYDLVDGRCPDCGSEEGIVDYEEEE